MQIARGPGLPRATRHAGTRSTRSALGVGFAETLPSTAAKAAGVTARSSRPTTRSARRKPAARVRRHAWGPIADREDAFYRNPARWRVCSCHEVRRARRAGDRRRPQPRYIASSLSTTVFVGARSVRFRRPFRFGALFDFERRASVLVRCVARHSMARSRFSRAVVAPSRGGHQGHITVGGHFGTFAAREILSDFPEIDSVIRQEAKRPRRTGRSARKRNAARIYYRASRIAPRQSMANRS